MPLTTHCPDDAGKGYLTGILRTGTLLIFFSVCLCLSVRQVEAQEKAQRSSKYACPVTPNLFPKQERSNDTLRFVFPENAGELPRPVKWDTSTVAQRISIALLSPEGKDVEIRFTWTGAIFVQPHINWGVHSGSFIVKTDGNPNCFFLGTPAGLPGNVPCREFQLEIPPGVQIEEVTFSNIPSEIPVRTCPMPELGKSINKALEDCRSNPEDEKKTLYALQLLEKAIPRYDCRRSYDYEPIPAWWMADYPVVNDWIKYMYKEVLEYNKYALKVYVEYLNTSDGLIAEVMDDQIWRILIGRPLFILENWDSIKDFKERVLGSVFMASFGSGVELISIYQKIAEENPIYRPTCEEIIDTIKKLLKKVQSTVQNEALSTAHSLHSF